MSAEQSKKSSMCTSYEIKWACDTRQWKDNKRNFQLTSTIADWLFDLVHYNTDEITMVERDWQIFHVAPGRVFVFIHLCAEDLKKRIQYPFKAPASGWMDRPLPNAEWTEHPYTDYWDFFTDRQKMQRLPSLITQARMYFSDKSQNTARDKRTVFSL